MKSIGERFKDKLLEAKKQSKKPKEEVDTDQQEDSEVVQARAAYEKQMEKLLKSFTTKQDKAILTLMISMGAPINALNLHKAELRKSIDPASERYMSNGSFRMWVKKFLGAIASATSVTESQFDQRLSNKYEHVVYHILKALGLPDGVEKSAARALLTGVKECAKLAVTDSTVRVYLQSLADQLGVDAKTINMAEPLNVTKAESKFPKETSVTGGVEVKENVEDAMAAVNSLLTTLGFDTKMMRSIDGQEKAPKVKGPLSKLGANPSLVKKLEMLTAIIADKTKTATSAAPQFSDVDHGDAQVVAEEAAEQGKWIIGKMGAFGVLLKTKGMTIKVDDKEAAKLGVGLDEQRKVSVREGDKRFIFTPGKKGAFTVHQQDDDTKFPDGIHISADEVQQILDVLATE